MSLDSDKYAVRKKAYDELMERGRAALPALKDVLKQAKLSVEARARIEEVVKDWGPVPAPGTAQARRFERAVQVLARIQTAGSATVLTRAAREDWFVWGKRIEGLQLRLRATKAVWRADETPILTMDAGNRGERLWSIAGVHSGLRVNIDGEWYVCRSELSDQLRPLVRPGRKSEPDTISLDRLDRLHRRGKDRHRVRLAPGRHVVWTACDAQERKGKQRVRLVSNLVIIEVVAKEAATSPAPAGASSKGAGTVRQGSPQAQPAEVEGPTVTGRVLEKPGGKGAEGVKVFLFGAAMPGKCVDFTASDKEGRYSFKGVARGRHRLSLGVTPGRYSEGVSVRVENAHVRQDLHLTLPQWISGTVFDVRTKQPVGGTRVSFYDGDKRGVPTDDKGRFRIYLQPGRRILYRAYSSERFYPVDRGYREIDLKPGQPVTDVDFHVRSAPTYTGQVIRADRKPARRANVTAVIWWRDPKGRKPWDVGGMLPYTSTVTELKTDDEGRFTGYFRSPCGEEEPVKVDLQTVAWSADGQLCGFAQARTTMPKPGVDPLTVVLGKPAAAVIRVFGSEGQEVSNATIVPEDKFLNPLWVNLGLARPVLGWRVKSLGEGRYRIERLIPGRKYAIYAGGPNATHVALTKYFTAHSGKTFDAGGLNTGVPPSATQPAPSGASSKGASTQPAAESRKAGKEATAEAPGVDRVDAKLRIPKHKWHAERVSNIGGESIAQCIENLGNFDDQHLAETSLGDVRGVGAIARAIVVTRLVRVRRLLEEGRRNPAAVIGPFRSSFKRALDEWPAACKEWIAAMAEADARGVAFTHTKATPYMKFKARSLAAVYVLAELGDHESLPLMIRCFEMGAKPREMVSPASRGVTLYGMHQLMLSYPEAKLTPRSRRIRQEYLAAAKGAIPEPKTVRVTAWSADYAESDPRIQLADPQKRVLRGQPSMLMRIYRPQFTDGSRFTSGMGEPSKRSADLFAKIKQFVGLAFPGTKAVEPAIAPPAVRPSSPPAPVRPNSRQATQPSSRPVSTGASSKEGTTQPAQRGASKKPVARPATQPAAEWGEVVGGVQCRLRTSKAIWKTGEPQFELDVRNVGKQALLADIRWGLLQLDGTWVTGTYRFSEPRRLNLRRGAQHTLVVRPFDGRRWRGLTGKAHLPLWTTPGKHTVRLALIIHPTTRSGGPVSVVSNPVQIRIPAALVVRGRVLGMESGKPVSRFKVYAFGTAFRPELEKGKWFASKDGRFVLDGLPGRRSTSLEIWIESEEHPTSRLEKVEAVVLGEAAERVYRLPKGRRVQGVLLDEATGKPLAGIPVTTGLIRYAPLGYAGGVDIKKVAITDKDGRFSFLEESWRGPIVSTSAYRKIHTVIVETKGYERLHIPPENRGNYTTKSGNLRIPLARGASISGIYSINGRPQRDVVLWLNYHSRRGLDQIRTDKKGRFHWGDLPAGIYDIGGPFRYRVVLKKAEHRFIDMGKELGPHTLAGQAKRDGKPLSSGRIYLRPRFKWAFWELYAKTDRQGNYRIQGLRPGKYLAYPGRPRSGSNPGANPYAPEAIEIEGHTNHNCDFNKRSATQAAAKRRSFTEIVRARPLPNLSRLAERSARGYKGADAAGAFYDILRLREGGSPKAVPVLEKILVANLGTRRIHKHAAAQALFCIGTPKAHQILSRELGGGAVRARIAIGYTFVWDMPEPKRSGFIRRYLLQNVSKDLVVEARARREPGTDGRQMVFAVKLRNVTDKPVNFSVRRIHLGKMLYLVSRNGRVVRGMATVQPKGPSRTWTVLQPGGSRRYDIQADLIPVGRLTKRQGVSEDSTVVLETRDMRFDIGEPGRFEVIAMVELSPWAEDRLKQLKLASAWSGRAVSKPITVQIGPAATRASSKGSGTRPAKVGPDDARRGPEAVKRQTDLMMKLRSLSRKDYPKEFDKLERELAAEGDVVIPMLIEGFRRYTRNTLFRTSVIDALQRIASPLAKKRLLELAYNKYDVGFPFLRKYAAEAYLAASQDPSASKDLLASKDREIQVLVLSQAHRWRALEDPIRKRLRELIRSAHFSGIQFLAAGAVTKDTDADQLRKSVSLILQVMAEMPKTPNANALAGGGGVSAGYLKWEKHHEQFIYTLSRVPGHLLREITPPGQRSVMIVALALAGDPRVRDDLRKIIRDPHAGMLRPMAVHTLRRIGTPADIPLLEKLVRSDPFVREKMGWGKRIKIHPVRITATGVLRILKDRFFRAAAKPAIEEHTKRIRAILPKGWSVGAEGSQITIKRPLPGEKPPVPGKKPPSLYLRSARFVISLRFAPPVTARQLPRMLEENKAAAAKLKGMRAEMRHIMHYRSGRYLPTTLEELKLVDAYKDLQGAHHDIPNLYTSEHSIFMRVSSKWRGDGLNGIADPKVRAECIAVRDKIEGLFHKTPRAPKRASTQPTAEWGKVVRGMQCRLRTDKAAWKAGRKPKFELDVRNVGKQDPVISFMGTSWCQFQVDGTWFAGSLRTEKAETLNIREGAQHTLVVRPYGGRWRWRSSKGKLLLWLAPGRHIVRLALRIHPMTTSGGPVSIVSNALEIEVGPVSATQPASARPSSRQATRPSSRQAAGAGSKRAATQPAGRGNGGMPVRAAARPDPVVRGAGRLLAKILRPDIVSFPDNFEPMSGGYRIRTLQDVDREASGGYLALWIAQWSKAAAKAGTQQAIRAFVGLGPAGATACNREIAKVKPEALAGPRLAYLAGCVGDRGSVPLLIDLLARAGEPHGDDHEAAFARSRTYAAATWALQQLSGRPARRTSASWKKWWKAVGGSFAPARQRAKTKVTVAQVRAEIANVANDEKELAGERLFALGPNALPHLLNELGDASGEVRYRTAWAIDELGAAGRIPAEIRREYFTRRLRMEVPGRIPGRAIRTQSFADFCRMTIDASRGHQGTTVSRMWSWLHSGGGGAVLRDPKTDIVAAVPIIVAGLEDRDRAARHVAIKLAGAVGYRSKARPPALIRALKKRWLTETGGRLRSDAASALAKFNTPEVRRAIRDGLWSDREEIVGDCASRAQILWDAAGYAEPTTTRPTEATPAPPKAVKVPEAVLARLEELTKHSTYLIRYNSVRTLQRKAPRRLAAHLSRLCQDREVWVRCACADAMKDLGDPAHTELLLKLIHDPDTRVSSHAFAGLRQPAFRTSVGRSLSAIGRAEGPEAVAALVGEIRNDRPGAAKSTTFRALQVMTGKKVITPQEVLAWWWRFPLDGRLPKAPAPDAKRLQVLWDKLTGEVGVEAYGATVAIAAAGDGVVAFLAERIKPVTADDKRIRALVGHLDDDKYAVRSRAFAELSRIGRPAGSAIREALKAGPSAEVRARAEQLLEAISKPYPATPDARQAARAIRVLELIGTPKAAKTLQALAQGTPGALVTGQAQTALKRIRQRAKPAAGPAPARPSLRQATGPGSKGAGTQPAGKGGFGPVIERMLADVDESDVLFDLDAGRTVRMYEGREKDPNKKFVAWLVSNPIFYSWISDLLAAAGVTAGRMRLGTTFPPFTRTMKVISADRPAAAGPPGPGRRRRLGRPCRPGRG